MECKYVNSMNFEQACQEVRNRSATMQISDRNKRLLYLYYKVATVGPEPDVSCPSVLSMKRSYWDIWKRSGHELTQEAAEYKYTELVKQLLNQNKLIH